MLSFATIIEDNLYLLVCPGDLGNLAANPLHLPGHECHHVAELANSQPKGSRVPGEKHWRVSQVKGEPNRLRVSWYKTFFFSGPSSTLPTMMSGRAREAMTSWGCVTRAGWFGRRGPSTAGSVTGVWLSLITTVRTSTTVLAWGIGKLRLIAGD